MCDVLLINPAFGKAEEKKYFPTGLGMIGAALKASGISYTVFDCDTTNAEKDENHCLMIEDIIIEEQPKVIGLTGCWVFYPFLKELSLKLKEKSNHLKIVGGGYWAFQAPEIILRKTGVDYIVHGEGDEVFPELVRCILGESDIDSLEGISVKGKDHVKIYDGSNLYIKKLDKLSYPDYEKFNMDFYINRFRLNYLLSRTYLTEKELVSKFGRRDYLRNAVINSARGCIGRCAFCSVAVSYYRRFTVEYIINHIRYLQETYDVQSITFGDSLTFINRKQTEEFCKAILNNSLKIIFHAVVRPDIDYTLETVRLLKHAGCFDLVFGMESGNARICNDIIGKRMSIPKAGELFDLCRREKLHTRITFIFNMPGETESAAWDTIKFIRNHKIERGGIYYANPLPKTRLYEMAKSRGCISDDEFYYEFNPGLDKGLSDFERYIKYFKFNDTPDYLVKNFRYISEQYQQVNYLENRGKRISKDYLVAWAKVYYILGKYFLYKIIYWFFGEKSRFTKRLFKIDNKK